jgi:hypothetical protein
MEIFCKDCNWNHDSCNRFCKAGLDRYEDSCCSTYQPTLKKEEVKMEDKKYYVYNIKSRMSNKEYTTLNTAVSEAERIAEIEQDTEILVVQAVVGIIRPSKQFTYKNYKQQ